ncbi:MAG TPA: Maf family nucleotide pyrophosphatase [Mycobacterium sp.]|nr:Maf family nucleotide pyrophosphatase [Mycobacterium sp.]
MTHLVLGSASTGRLSVLRGAGVEPTVIVSDVDEDAVLAAHAGADPADAVAALARAKAEVVAARVPPGLASDCVVIGCDSMLLLRDRLCGKPGTVERARAQWASMAGHSGRLLSGHAAIRLRDGEIAGIETGTDSTTVYFGTPTPDDLDAYLASGEPLGVAGGFTLDGLGGWFVDRIDGDPSNVVGLSLPLLRRLLASLQVSVAAVWAANPPR